MPNPREEPLRFTPRSVADTVDGDNVSPGACMSLQNLLFDPGTPGELLCRPANLLLDNAVGRTVGDVITAGLCIGNLVYGLAGSPNNIGTDYPFVFNIGTSSFLSVNGITSGNIPTSQALTGNWTPPIMDQVGTKIFVTHVGFNYAGGYAFGFFDISSFSETVTANTVNASPIITGNAPLAGLAPGYTITGTGIPANTVIKTFAPVTITATGTTHSNTTVDSITPNTTGMAAGQPITGSGISPGTTIFSVNSSSSITLSQAATASATVTITATGTTITMSANASSTNNQESITIAGGTPTNPLWCAGNTTGNVQLAGVATAVRQFNNRAYFSQSNNVIFTDTFSTNVTNTNGVQVLTIDDSTPVTGLCGLPQNQTTGGILQALEIFKAYSIWQVTGDPVTNNLALNQISGTVGCSAPRTVVPTPQGIVFMAVDGIRTINLLGNITQPDPNLRNPFIYALFPSRCAAAFNSNIYRISVQNSKVIGNPWQGYYFDVLREGWTGPHSFEDDLILPYTNDFVVASNAISQSLFQSFAVQNQNSQGNTFTENGSALTWAYETAPMTDLGNIYANEAIDTTLQMVLPGAGDTYQFQAIDQGAGVIGLAQVKAPMSEAIWDAFNWGDGTLWGVAQAGLSPQPIPWTQPLIFSKLTAQASGNSSLGLRLGSWYVGYEKLNYLMPGSI